MNMTYIIPLKIKEKKKHMCIIFFRMASFGREERMMMGWMLKYLIDKWSEDEGNDMYQTIEASEGQHSCLHPDS
jgi:hypothetical protein